MPSFRTRHPSLRTPELYQLLHHDKLSKLAAARNLSISQSHPIGRPTQAFRRSFEQNLKVCVSFIQSRFPWHAEL